MQISEPGRWPFPTAVSCLIHCFEAGQHVTGVLEMLLARPGLETRETTGEDKADGSVSVNSGAGRVVEQLQA